jgi:hypothetical protein
MRLSASVLVFILVLVPGSSLCQCLVSVSAMELLCTAFQAAAVGAPPASFVYLSASGLHIFRPPG